MKPLSINLRHLATRTLRLQGDLSAKELDLNEVDSLVQVQEPVRYDLEVEKTGNSILVRGELTTTLACQCVRCLKAFPLKIDQPDFVLEVPLEGPEAAAISSDCVDLTPYVREDIVLAFPQHPLCEPGCAGLLKDLPPGNEAQPGQESQMTSSAWAVLNELKF